jgi:hypothetical protein
MTTRLFWWLAVASVAFPLAACGDLNVSNPNAPERERAFSDPATIVAAGAGVVKTYVNTRWAYDPAMTMSAMADSYTASWNNFNMRYYSSYGVDCPNRCAWVNSTSTQLGDQVQGYWYGMYSAISSANDALFAIRLASPKPDLGSDAVPTEVIAQMIQGAAHLFIGLNYDQGFVVEEKEANDTPDQLAALPMKTRAELRDAGIAMLEKGVIQARAVSFTTSTSVFAGPQYTSKQLAKVMRTMQAEGLAFFPRSAEENAQVDWQKVAQYASEGISSSVDAAPFQWEAFQSEQAWHDGYNGLPINGFFSGFHQWGNDYTSVRVDTRVARLLSTTQKDPYPGGAGSAQPADANGNPIGGVYGVDLRLGDGCFGADAEQFGLGECAATPLSGTDFMWSPVAIFNPTRGSFHQSNLGWIRDHCISGFYPDCPTGSGNIPIFTLAFNDLLWAEGLLRGGGDIALAVQLINNSRVGRGGLAPVTVANSTQELLAALIYEQEMEHLPVAFAMFANRRRETKASGDVDPPAYNNIWKETPRQMPIPAKDLTLLRQEFYTFGGVDNPQGFAPAVTPNSAGGIRNVRQIWADLQRKMKVSGSSRHK